MATQFELPVTGWRVTGPSGEVLAQSEGPTAATLAAITDTERGGDDGSDRSGPSESDS